MPRSTNALTCSGHPRLHGHFASRNPAHVGNLATWRCGRRVLVVPTDPDLERVALVTALRCAVEDRVVAHQEVDPAPPGRIGMVDGPVVQGEGAEALGLGQVTDDVGAALARIAAGDRRQLL